MKVICAFLAFILFHNNCVCTAYNILGIFHTISKTQFIAGSTLMKELVRRGHNVTTVSPFSLDLSMKNYTEVVLDGMLAKNKEYLDNYRGVKSSMLITRILNLYEIGDMMTIGTLQHPHFQGLLQSKSHYDLIIIDATMNDALLSLGHHFNAPIIEYDTTGVLSRTHDLKGQLRFLFTQLVREPLTKNSGFQYRLTNAMISAFELFYTNYIYLPRQKELSSIYLSSHWNRHGREPALKLSKNLGADFHKHLNQIGLEALAPKSYEPSLSKKTRDFLETSIHGVIFVSLDFHMPNDTLATLTKSFNSRKERILWNSNVKENIELPENVMLSNELSDNVLGHPKIKLFINEGNLQNILSAASYGVPAIAITEFLDQSYNVASAINAGWAVEIDLDDLDEWKLNEAVDEIVTNSVYSKSAKYCSKRIHDVGLSTLELAASWVEHLIRHKDGFEINSESINFVDAYNIDIIAFIVILAAVSTYVIGFIVKKILVTAVLFYLNVNVKEKQM